MGSEIPLYRGEDYEQKLRKLKEKPKAQALEEIMEKLAILSYFIGREAYTFMSLDAPIFKEMYKGYFNNIDTDTVWSLFMDKMEPYSDMLQAMLIAEMRLKKALPARGRNYLLPYKQAVQKVTEKQSKGYALDVLRNDMKMDAIFRALTHQMWKNIERREKEGIPQKMTKTNIREYMKGHITRDNDQLVQRLIAEANTQLKLLKLPSYFSKYKNTMIETVKENTKLIAGGDPNTALFRMAIAKETIKENTIPSKQAHDIADHEKQLEKILNRDKEIQIEEVKEDDIENFSSNQMEKMGFKEMSTEDLTFDKSGKLSFRDESEMSEKKKKEQNEILENLRKISLDRTPQEDKKERDYYVKLGEEVIEKSKLIKEALEAGQPMDDDPIYRKILRVSERYRKIREEATGEPIDPLLLKRVKAVDRVGPVLIHDANKIVSVKKRINRKAKRNNNTT